MYVDSAEILHGTKPLSLRFVLQKCLVEIYFLVFAALLVFSLCIFRKSVLSFYLWLSTRFKIMCCFPQGSTEQHQLALITKLCGSITPEVWPLVENYELYNKMELVKGQQRRVCERLKHYVKDGLVMSYFSKFFRL